MGSSSKSKNKGGDIIVQGSILAAAQIIVRQIGLFYRIPLQRIAGDVAMGYYGYAYDIYMLLLLVSSNGVPLAVSKLVSKTHAKRDYTNEHRIMVSALLWTLVVGSVIGLGTFIFAEQITSAVFGPGDDWGGAGTQSSGTDNFPLLCHEYFQRLFSGNRQHDAYSHFTDF